MRRHLGTRASEVGLSARGCPQAAPALCAGADRQAKPRPTMRRRVGRGSDQTLLPTSSLALLATRFSMLETRTSENPATKLQTISLDMFAFGT